MGRYDQNRNKKSNATTFFIVAAIAALSIGLFGSFFVIKNKGDYAPQTSKTLSSQTQPPQKATAQPRSQQAINQKLTSPDSYLAVRDLKSFPLPSKLPDLLGSDELFRKTLTTLSPGLAAWLDNDQLIRRYVILVNDFAQGIRETKHMSFLRPDQLFSVEQGENYVVIAPKSYQRFNKLAQAIQVINPTVAAAIYQSFRPLMQQVFKEFGHPPDISLEIIIQKAAADLLAAPVIEEPIGLVRPSSHYKFANAELEESLSPLQKQMIRMGPENTRIIQAKVRELMVELAKVELK
jgi:Protein of unknown function (DUF3014)